MEINEKENFGFVDVIATGRWRLCMSRIDNRHKLYCDKEFKKILSASEDMSPEESFNYWMNNIDDEFKTGMKDFLDKSEFNEIPTENQYIWACPETGRRVFRSIGKVENINGDYVEYIGTCQDITGMYSSNGADMFKKEYTDRLIFNLSRQNDNLVETLGTIVEFRNMEDDTHIKCVKLLTELLARYFADNYPEYGITRKSASMLAAASPLHDVGKIAISDMILLKPGRLTRAEFDMMKTHSRRGYDIIHSLQSLEEGPYKRYCEEIALRHHEKYDGRGYPDGLEGDNIPISAQIVSLADVYDALITPRVYKDTYTPKQAYNMIMRGECGVFNPKLLEAFKSLRPKFEEVARKYKTGSGDGNVII